VSNLGVLAGDRTAVGCRGRWYTLLACWSDSLPSGLLRSIAVS